MISTALTFQDDATRLTNNGDDSSKRKASIPNIHTGNSERTTKRAKNQQERPATRGTKDNPSKDDVRKPAARKTTASTMTRRVNAPNLNCTFTVRRKVAIRTDRLNLEPPPQNIPGPLPSLPQAQEIPARKKRRVEEPLLPPRQSSRLSTDTPLPIPPKATVDASTRRQSRRQTQTPSIETSEAQLDGNDHDADYDDDDADFSDPLAPLTLTVDTSTRRRSSRCGIPTSSTATSAPPPSADTVHASTRRQSRRQIQRPQNEEQLDTDDDDDSNDDDGDLSGSFWDDRFSELADYRKIHGHCNVPRGYPENVKLAYWVPNQRQLYRLHQEGKQSSMTTYRIQELESLGFEWDRLGTAWEERLSELAGYRKIKGHCNVPTGYPENVKLGRWVNTQRTDYKLRQERKKSNMTNYRIQELESLGFEWDRLSTGWEERLNELADYYKIHGHSNVPTGYPENVKLGRWVPNQRQLYRLHQEGKQSSMTTYRIQELESLGFEWDRLGTAWEERLSELAGYRKINGHCNVPTGYPENVKLGRWVNTQRTDYKLRQESKKSNMTTSRIQELESLGFEWNSLSTGWEERLNELADYYKIHGHSNVPQRHSENIQLGRWVNTQRTDYKLRQESKKSNMTTSRIQELESLGFEWDGQGATWEGRLNELADYRKIHGHCNVPRGYPENVKLAYWVPNQRKQYRLHLEGKSSHMTTSRIHELESLGFEWDGQGAAWKGRLNELADYYKIHGHSNVPRGYPKNVKLGRWVNTQRTDYKLRQESKKSNMTTSRIRELESLDFEWKPSAGRKAAAAKASDESDNGDNESDSESDYGEKKPKAKKGKSKKSIK